MRKFKGLDLVKFTDIVAEDATRERPDAIVCESTGPGAGVIDMLRNRNFKVIEVHPGAQARDHRVHFNRRAELWYLMREWLMERGCIMDDPALFDGLANIMYSLDRHEQRTKLEPKEEMKKRGLPSPDEADTLALTFAVTLPRRDTRLNRQHSRPQLSLTEYDPLEGF